MRQHIDCRTFPNAQGCTVAITASTEKELLEAAIQHAVAVHGYRDTPEVRSELKKAFREGNPAA